MVSEFNTDFVTLERVTVLILVLVEDGLGVSDESGGLPKEGVLILVLVEDGLGAMKKLTLSKSGEES